MGSLVELVRKGLISVFVVAAMAAPLINWSHISELLAFGLSLATFSWMLFALVTLFSAEPRVRVETYNWVSPRMRN
jgi:hypothetical protein